MDGEIAMSDRQISQDELPEEMEKTDVRGMVFVVPFPAVCKIWLYAQLPVGWLA